MDEIIRQVRLSFSEFNRFMILVQKLHKISTIKQSCSLFKRIIKHKKIVTNSHYDFSMPKETDSR